MTKPLKKELRICQELESSSAGYPNIEEVINLKPEGTLNLNKKKQSDFRIKDYFAVKLLCYVALVDKLFSLRTTAIH